LSLAIELRQIKLEKKKWEKDIDVGSKRIESILLMCGQRLKGKQEIFMQSDQDQKMYGNNGHSWLILNKTKQM